jgi:signal transduction histidine kinase
MGCNTCNQTETQNDNNENQTLNLIPSDLAGSTFLFRVITFFVIIIAIPLIILVLVGQIFISFFFPKSLPNVTKKFKNLFMGIFTKYAEFKYKREIRKRENQFKDTTSYVGKNIDDIEIFDNNKKNND